MKLLNKFIDWRKNIEPHTYFGISMVLDSDITTIDTVKKDVYQLADLISDKKLQRKFVLNDIEYSEDEYGRRYTMEFDYDMRCRPVVSSYFGLAHNILKRRKMNRISCSFRMNTINHDLLVGLSKIKGLTLMILFNPHFKSWENNNRPDSYKYRNGIKTYFCERSKIEKVDLSHREGRMTGIGNITWHGGSEYWFGPSFYKKITKEKILEFEHADIVQELPDDLVYIKLMDLADYWSNESQGRLSDLRYQLEIDRLEKEYLESIE